MPRTIDLPALRNHSANAVKALLARYNAAVADNLHYLFLRWIAQMSAVELHAIWERYAENRLVAALNHHPGYFLAENAVRGVSRVPAGLALYVVRGGGRYFDFRSMDELIDKSNRLVGADQNPFRPLSATHRHYLDALAAIRNSVVHGSAAAVRSYKRALRTTYGINAAPEPNEFLHARDNRAASLARYQPRLCGLATVVLYAIQHT